MEGISPKLIHSGKLLLDYCADNSHVDVDQCLPGNCKYNKTPISHDNVYHRGGDTG
jgi:hypothetical protein